MYRNKEYLEYIKDQPCMICGSTQNIDAHHFGYRGLSQKTDDYRTVPLCRKCHTEYHNNRFTNLNITEIDFLKAQLYYLIEWIEK